MGEHLFSYSGHFRYNVGMSHEVLLSVGGLEIRWYGVLYVVAFGLAWWLVPRLGTWRGLVLTADQWLVVVASGIGGVLAGGRVGYVVLYEPQFFADHPLKIFAINEGGMAFHGGLVGVAVALWLVSRWYRVPYLGLLDVIVIPAAIGLSLGRLGNFINGELIGTPTTLPWGVIFPGENIARHPVQLYAALKDIGLVVLCTWYFFRSRTFRVGGTTAIFLMGYGILRLLLGFIREPDGWSATITSVNFTEGQILTLPLVIIGVVLWWRAGHMVHS